MGKTIKRMQNDTKERENRGSLFPRVKKSMSGEMSETNVKCEKNAKKTKIRT